MPAHKYVGPYATFYGSGLPTDSGSGMVYPGEVYDFDGDPPASPYWVPVDNSTGIPPLQDPEAPAGAPAVPDVTDGAPIPEPAPADVNTYTQTALVAN